MEDRRFIEEMFPVKEVSEESAREKSIRHGNISTLHIWWARKPHSSSRATIFGTLVPANVGQEILLKNERSFIIQLSNSSAVDDVRLIDLAKKKIIDANGGAQPRILDPFAGGGSIPFEALRLGCDTYASDYNPVSALILKCTVEYPQKYGGGTKMENHGLVSKKERNPLLEEVKGLGKSVLAAAATEIQKFYPCDEDGSTPVAYIWAKTIHCQNPACGAEIPLLAQYWLMNNGGSGVALYPENERGVVKFKIVKVGEKESPKNFNPDKGNVTRGIATCFVCGYVVDGRTTSRLFRGGKSSERLIAVILHRQGTVGKKYRIATNNDIAAFEKAREYLETKLKRLSVDWGIKPVPDEPTPEGNGPGAERAFALRNYNMNEWGDLFNARQKLALAVLVEKTRNSYDKMVDRGHDPEFARAVVTYLALGIDRLLDFGSSLAMLNPHGSPRIAHTFGRPILQMTWTYAEANPFNPEAAGWVTACEKNEEWIDYASSVGGSPAKVAFCSATRMPYSNGYFDAVFTDPPYYDNIPYSYLSDFFYVWLKRTVGHLYPDLFTTPLTPKSEEIVAYSNIQGGFEAGKKFFEEGLRKSFGEIHRVLRPNGITIIVYAHKSTAGWETLINSLLDSGLVVTGAWPVHTEKRGRLRSQESAALASSIYVIARKLDRKQTGFYSEVRNELKAFLNKKLDRVWGEGISGADFFISAIASAIEVFGKYEKVIDDEGSTIRADRLLEDVRRIVTDYAVKQVLHNGFAAEIKPITRFYVLWRWAYGDSVVDFDEARKLGQSVGIDVSQEWNKGFISKEKEFIEVLEPEERELDDLEGSTELIDVLHRVLILWKTGKLDEVTRVLRETGYGKSDVFYRVAQAISESLTNDSKEKKLLEGFLSGKERIVKEVKKEAGQTRLFE